MHIRLLKAAIDEHQLATMHDLLHYRLDEAPTYEALSYTWGCPQPAQGTRLRTGQTITVSPNLSSALNHVPKAMMQSFLWVDQISISQEGIPERNQEVTIMTNIYRKCTRVIFRFGDGDSSMMKYLPVLVDAVSSPEGAVVQPKIEDLKEKVRPLLDLID